VRLVLDEHLSPTIAEELRRRGHDVVAVAEAGMREQPDAALLDWAVAQDRAVVTANYADFRALHQVRLSRGEGHRGIVYVPRRFSLSQAGFGRLITALDWLLNGHPSNDALESAEVWLLD